MKFNEEIKIMDQRNGRIRGGVLQATEKVWTGHGNDLVLNVPGDAATTRIQDYFLNGTAWTVTDTSRNFTDTWTLIAETERRLADVVETLKSEFVTGVAMKKQYESRRWRDGESSRRATNDKAWREAA